MVEPGVGVGPILPVGGAARLTGKIMHIRLNNHILGYFGISSLFFPKYLAPEAILQYLFIFIIYKPPIFHIMKRLRRPCLVITVS